MIDLSSVVKTIRGFMSSHYLIALLVGLALSWMISPSKACKGGQRWGRGIASVAVFIATISQLWRVTLPPPHGGTNAIATWVLISIVLGVGSYLIGVFSYFIFHGAKKVSKTAIPAAKELAKAGIDSVKETTFEGTKKCPFCAETIKKSAIFCRFCQHDVPVDLVSASEFENGAPRDQVASKPIPSKWEEPTENPEEPQPVKQSWALIGLAIITIAAGVGWLNLTQKIGTDGASEQEGNLTSNAIPPSAATPPSENQESIITLEPFTVNLTPSYPQEERYLQIQFSIILDERSLLAFRARETQARNNVTLLLAGKMAQELRTKEGKLRLQAELVSEINDAIGIKNDPQRPTVKELLFTRLVIQ